MKTLFLQLLFVLFACSALAQKKEQKKDLYQESYALINQSYRLLKDYRDSAIIVDTISLRKISENFERFDKQIHLVDSSMNKTTSKIVYKNLKSLKKDLVSHKKNHLRYFKKKIRYLELKEEIDKVSAVYRWCFFV